MPFSTGRPERRDAISAGELIRRAGHKKKEQHDSRCHIGRVRTRDEDVPKVPLVLLGAPSPRRRHQQQQQQQHPRPTDVVCSRPQNSFQSTQSSPREKPAQRDPLFISEPAERDNCLLNPLCNGACVCVRAGACVHFAPQLEAGRSDQSDSISKASARPPASERMM